MGVRARAECERCAPLDVTRAIRRVWVTLAHVVNYKNLGAVLYYVMCVFQSANGLRHSRHTHTQIEWEVMPRIYVPHCQRAARRCGLPLRFCYITKYVCVCIYIAERQQTHSVCVCAQGEIYACGYHPFQVGARALQNITQLLSAEKCWGICPQHVRSTPAEFTSLKLFLCVRAPQLCYHKLSMLCSPPATTFAICLEPPRKLQFKFAKRRSFSTCALAFSRRSAQ